MKAGAHVKEPRSQAPAAGLDIECPIQNFRGPVAAWHEALKLVHAKKPCSHAQAAGEVAS